MSKKNNDQARSGGKFIKKLKTLITGDLEEKLVDQSKIMKVKTDEDRAEEKKAHEEFLKKHPEKKPITTNEFDQKKKKKQTITFPEGFKPNPPLGKKNVMISTRNIETFQKKTKKK